MYDVELWHDLLCEVTGFEAVERYVLRVQFSDGTARIIDFEPILYGPLFGPLRDLQLFNRVKVDADLGTLVWPTGADIDPDVLHDWPVHVDAIVARRRKQYAGAIELDEHFVTA